jgi:tetratricopeptide (TPR) repeat protein
MALALVASGMRAQQETPVAPVQSAPAQAAPAQAPAAQPNPPQPGPIHAQPSTGQDAPAQAAPAPTQPAPAGAPAAGPASAPATGQGATPATTPAQGWPSTGAPAPGTPGQTAPGKDSKPGADAKPEKQPRLSDRRKATRLYLASSKLFENGKFEEAMKGYEDAARLDPTNSNYALAAGVARSYAVGALIQDAAKDRMRSDQAAERAALAHALELDPKSVEATEHLHELSDDEIRGLQKPLYGDGAGSIGDEPELKPTPGLHSFHVRTDRRQAIEQVFKAYGIQPTVDESVRAGQVRLDVDDASFAEAAHVVGLLTSSFYVALDAHRVLVARDTRDNRQQFTRLDMETVYLPGLSTAELTDVGNLVKNVFDAQQSVVEQSTGTITIRAQKKTLDAFNATMRELIDGRNQVILDVRLIQIAHTSGLNTGVQPPQTITAFNLYSQEQSILNSNQALVQQIISSGLAAPGDVEAIIAILIASGSVTSSIFSNGLALFGGGLTLSGVSPQPATLNLNLNTSDSRELDEVRLRVGDGEDGSLKLGERYPITTSSFSSLAGSTPNIPGLTSPGASGGLSGLLSQLGGLANVPQVQYEDLGLQLKLTPRVMRSGDVALTVDLKIDALSGTSINGNPILDNRAYSAVVTLKDGAGVVVMSELDKQEMRSIDGLAGISEIPGLNDLTGKDTQKSYSTLLIVMTPHVVRGTQLAGHSAMMRVERGTGAR